MKCLIKDNKVVQLSENEFPVHSSLTWMDAPDGCQTGWVLIDGVLQEKPQEPQTKAQLLQEYKNAIKALLNRKANEKDYDSEQSIVNYYNSTNATWKQEATNFIAWRDSVWSYAYNILAQVENGEIELPTISDFIANAPK